MKNLNTHLVGPLVAVALIACAASVHAASPRLARKTPPGAKAKPAKPAPKSTSTPAKPAEVQLTGNLAAFKPGAEPEGFRSFKWGAAFSEFSDLKDDNADGEINGRKVKDYLKTGDDLSFLGLQADHISYVFSSDKFYGVGIEYKKMNDAGWDNIVKSLTDQYGKVPELRLDNQPTYIWWGDRSFVRVKRYTDWCYLDVWSTFFFGDVSDKTSQFVRALSLGDMPQVKKLVEADPNIPKSMDGAGEGCLLWSLQCHPKDNPEQIIEYLISKGADVNLKAKDGTTPLERASSLGILSMVKLLVSKGADVNMKSWNDQTPVITASYSHPDVAEFLISKGADVMQKDKDGETAIHAAAGSGETDLVKLLISKGADVNARDKDGCPPLYSAVTMPGKVDAIAALIENGADINARESKEGENILQHAAEWGATDSVKLLLSKGADVSAKDNGGHTALHYAVRLMGKAETIKALAQAGAELNAKESKYGQTPLHVAIDEHNDEAVKALLEIGADVNAKDNNGNTTLQYAIDDKEDQIADLIRQHGGTQ